MEKLKEFAEKLNGRQYRNELTKELEAYAKENGIVVVFGASDDLMELRGAIDEECDCWGGETFWISENGKVYSAQYAHLANGQVLRVDANWCPKGSKYSWEYETFIPHETFDIMEDDEPYCRGIVFYLKDLKPKKTNIDRITEGEGVLAEHMVHLCYETYYDCNRCEMDSRPYYTTVTGACYYTKEGAIQHTIEWLQKECE